MKYTTINRAKRYGVYASDLIEFAEEYGYKFLRVEHYKRGYGMPTRDTIVVAIDDEMEADVEVLVGDCPECGERCAAYGWADGGYHHSTCRCEMIDFSP